MAASSQSGLLEPPIVPPPIAPPIVAQPAVARHAMHPRWLGTDIRQPFAKTKQTPPKRAKSAEIQNIPIAWPLIEEEQPFKAKPKRSVRCYRAFKRRIEDTPAWLISTVLHLILLLVLAFITISIDESSPLLLSLSQGDRDAVAAFTEFSIAPVELPDEFTSEADHETEIQTVELPPQPIVIEPISFASVEPMLDAMKQSSVSDGISAKLAAMDTSMFGGRSGAMKKALLREFGGTEETEKAVELGLQWLKRQQNYDGSWSLVGPYSSGAPFENKTAATAMALLAFMGAGNTHQSGIYRVHVQKAAAWLVAQQDRSGFMAHKTHNQQKMYAQAQATIALCELYAMTKDDWLHPHAQAACDFAVQSQSPQGGWRYQPRFDSDTSVTGWFVMGLKSGQAAGLRVERYVFDNVEKYLDSVGSDYNSQYAYKLGEVASPSMTAEGILCRQYLGWHRNQPGMAQGLGSLATNHPLNTRAPDVYYWYYATQAMHHYGGPLWTQWNETMRVGIPATQIQRGNEKGSWSPLRDAWGSHGGRLYTTCMSLYCLEVYYRHMPLYSLDEE
ncbi:hypothetical protein CA13_07550 [Planctomycetes bacterium CA13]|uniref:Squalene cyclase C-terminal domain-containing protein n=1 Tax=Novipirellula herctigrandis TaxID=2527986 RepID=A0A5C5YWI0_9BACT|nr:hypothetical protein CA13_07550 [Planctomycetes bacterium CA13]